MRSRTRAGTNRANQLNRRTFLGGAATACAAAAVLARTPPAFAAGGSAAPRSADLGETGPQQRRWMSLPESRIAVNPFNGTTGLTELQYTTGPDLALNFGYYVENEAAYLPSAVGLYRRSAGQGSIDIAWRDEFDSLDPAWTVGPYVDASVASGQLRLNLQQASPDWWGTLTRWVDMDLDTAPYVQISVTSLADAWGLRVVKEGTTSEIVVQADSNDTGTFTYDIADATGWSGQVRVQLVLRVAAWEKPAQFDFIRILGVTAVLSGTTGFDSSWSPFALPFQAEYGDSAVHGSDFFIDTDTVLRSCNLGGTGLWSLTGAYVGSPQWDRAGRTLTVTGDAFSYAIAFSAAPAGDAGFFGTLLELISATGNASPAPDRGYWSVPLAASTSALTIAVGFATAGEGGGPVAAQRARAGLRVPSVGEARRRQELFWDKLLQDVPRPENFDVLGAPAHGVTADQVRATYYKAWVFLVAGVLPPMPENDFPYHQIAAGKPSLYKEGPPGAAASATWDSILAMQFYAYLDPDVAWSAYRGMLSLVDADGVLAGEALPSRKAQTGAVLYALTGDLGALREVYPALRRYLLWAESDPRWIFKNNTAPGLKDADFVVSVLIDMAYARDMAQTLGYAADVRMWDQHRAATFADYLHWFWTSPTATPVEYYQDGTGARSPGGTLWISGGMHLDLWPSGSPELAGLRQRFLRDYRADAAFAGFGQPRYSDMCYTIYGLLDQGLREQAVVLANAALRDIVRAGEFAETYTLTDPPKPTGVMPSFFGVGSVIDTLWMNNGYRMDGGRPQLVRYAGAGGGITGLRVRGRTLDVALSAGSTTVRLSGSYLRSGQGCAQVTVPLGATVPIPAGCSLG